MNDATNALADAWASIDGKLEEFRKGREAPGLDTGGYYAGYLAEAKELIERLNRRGFDIVPSPQFWPDDPR